MVIKTDLSRYVIGKALLQYDDKGVLRLVTFFLKKNNTAEFNYLMYDKELLAVIRYLK